VAETWDRVVALTGALNFRDIGGYSIRSGGVVRVGHVFRSDSLHRCSEEDVAVLDGLGIRAVYDLRRPEEIEEAPGPRRHVHVEIQSQRLRDTDPAALQDRADGERWLLQDYLTMLERSGAVFGRLFSLVVEPDGAPCVFHCYGGKDRTGMAAALLLTWLGVDRGDVLDDYELTGALGGPDRLPQVVEEFVAMGFGQPAAQALLTTPRWAMTKALNVLDNEYGGIERYLRGPAGMNTETLGLLHDVLVAR
jgi:protein-tyrosine phosphatase